MPAAGSHPLSPTRSLRPLLSPSVPGDPRPPKELCLPPPSLLHLLSPADSPTSPKADFKLPDSGGEPPAEGGGFPEARFQVRPQSLSRGRAGTQLSGHTVHPDSEGRLCALPRAELCSDSVWGPGQREPQEERPPEGAAAQGARPARVHPAGPWGAVCLRGCVGSFFLCPPRGVCLRRPPRGPPFLRPPRAQPVGPPGLALVSMSGVRWLEVLGRSGWVTASGCAEVRGAWGRAEEGRGGHHGARRQPRGALRGWCGDSPDHPRTHTPCPRIRRRLPGWGPLQVDRARLWPGTVWTGPQREGARG